jgi:hypothetical protein
MAGAESRLSAAALRLWKPFRPGRRAGLSSEHDHRPADRLNFERPIPILTIGSLPISSVRGSIVNPMVYMDPPSDTQTPTRQQVAEAHRRISPIPMQILRPYVPPQHGPGHRSRVVA